MIRKAGLNAMAGAVGCATLLVACGDDGGAAGDDAFCAGARRLDRVYGELQDAFGELAGMVDESGLIDEAAAEEAAPDLVVRLPELADEALAAFDEMTTAADGDLRRDLEEYGEYGRAALEPLADAESADEIDAALDQEPEPPPGVDELVQRIDQATEERCDVTLIRDPFEAILEAPTAIPPDVDPCSLLPDDALTDAGVLDTGGTPDDDNPPNLVSCEWGERFGGEGAHLELGLWDPPIPDVLEDLYDEREPVAGRPAYVEPNDHTWTCRLAVDAGDYLVTVDLDLLQTPAGQDALACETAEELAASALSSLS